MSALTIKSSFYNSRKNKNQIKYTIHNEYKYTWYIKYIRGGKEIRVSIIYYNIKYIIILSFNIKCI